jgi:hypothetical protein
MPVAAAIARTTRRPVNGYVRDRRGGAGAMADELDEGEGTAAAEEWPES